MTATAATPNTVKVSAEKTGGRLAPAQDRLAVRFQLQYADDEAFVRGYAGNVSAAGMFVAADEPPPPGTALNCAEAGVLGVLPGIIGLIQTTEALKLLLGIGEPLIGRLLTLDALPMTFREIPIRKDPDCPICGPNGPKTLDGIEYSEFSCAIPLKVENAIRQG